METRDAHASKKRLVTATVPVTNSLLTGNVPVNNFLLTGTIFFSKKVVGGKLSPCFCRLSGWG